MRVKICGVTNADDAMFIEESGADAIGVVISPESARNVTLEKADLIFSSLGPFITRVVVTHTTSPGELDKILSVNPDAVQLSSGIKMPEYFSGRVIRVIGKNTPVPDDCDALIIDESRGSGRLYDHSFAKEISEKSDIPVILSGGLNSSNVHHAAEEIRPYAVDVCSGVEERPGIKNRFEVLEFLRECGKAPGVKLKKGVLLDL
ncbi:phosphoribosylanthranilate isomerase [Methanomicrobium sp. W14]|uniref:phosphoribosylanthranilate isomerase n=1 Tax=Methanomicrobium sp. W14 TaxID=2817839 RepID=UPI001AEAD75D|nr:phosphoribosylanthranilate isomerase [Methanomicrobium sp. W14]MBP2132261.1 phosphoribosylanthranilate isomerase [Methanomicrobium sp. W14]